ncbi:MAG: cation:proton antiporter [Planctomycetota bacterium]|nr:cation:proton antiporter [Planctomycetota bacterium]
MLASLIEQPKPLLVLAVILVVGVASGALAKRLRVPSVTGQIVAGILLGPIFHVFSHSTVQGMAPITSFALGLMAVAVGSHLNVARLSGATRRLVILLVCEALITPVIVYGTVMLTGAATWTTGLLIATIAISTAPATILAIVKETRSKGVFVKTLVAAVALNNIACILLFELAHMVALTSLTDGQDIGVAVWLEPLKALGYALALGGGVGVILVLATRHVVRSDRLATLSLIAILATAGLASQIEASALLSCLFLGIALANLSPDKEEIGHEVFDSFETAIFAIFFTLAGMELNFDYLGEAGILAVLVFGARIVGKLLSANIAMRAAGATNRVRKNLGLALLPQAGLAVGLMLLVTEDPRFPEDVRGLILALVLTVVLLNEIVGPIVARIALARSGDLGKDRARLIDFIHEEHIITDLKADTLEEAIGRLTDVLIRRNNLQVDREKLLASALQHEEWGSTCLGEGLAVPFADLEEGRRIVGAVGISSEGLAFDTPDGEPVHCMVLLATPPSQRDHRNEVTAAFATAILSDSNIEHQLYHARSPAHAYELLHHDEAEDFNHFLED